MACFLVSLLFSHHPLLTAALRMLGDSISWEGWPACGEIDIMETVNVENTCYGTVHWSDNNNNYASYGGKTGNSMGDWHTYSVEWTSTTITWYVDGRQYHIIGQSILLPPSLSVSSLSIYADITNGINGTGEFQNSFFFILNLAIGGNWPGFNIDNGAFPAYMFVDYVRVYQ
jgi:beta-glucanase (GH16 family)